MRIVVRMPVMPVSMDIVFTTADCAAEQRFIPDSKLCVPNTDWGHLGAMGIDSDYLRQVDLALLDLLAV